MKKTFKLKGLECANCAAKMEKAINKLDGVDNATISFLTTKMIIEASEDKMSDIISEAKKIVKKIESQVIIQEIK